jgi:hypothetical protein
VGQEENTSEFAMALRELLGRVIRGEVQARTAHEQRLLRRVAVALEAFEIARAIEWGAAARYPEVALAAGDPATIRR